MLKKSATGDHAVPCLVEMSRNIVMQNIDQLDVSVLPECILDDIILAPNAIGRSVVRDFLACAALDWSERSEASNPSNDDEGKVS